MRSGALVMVTWGLVFCWFLSMAPGSENELELRTGWHWAWFLLLVTLLHSCHLAALLHEAEVTPGRRR